MSRKRKLLTAGAILVAGIALAWPFRRLDFQAQTNLPLPVDVPRSAEGDPITSSLPEANTPEAVIPVAPGPVAAHVASTTERDATRQLADTDAFDIASHPAGAPRSSEWNDPASALRRSATDSPSLSKGNEARPAYPTTPTGFGDDWPTEVRHIVRNGDTLERLAERYLDDAGRAMEIFDLNRDQLSNPHLLPIGVELRIPVEPSRQID